jgi:hypothetical protein
MHPVAGGGWRQRDDTAFVARMQNAADWLTESKALPEKVTVAEYLAPVCRLPFPRRRRVLYD